MMTRIFGLICLLLWTTVAAAQPVIVDSDEEMLRVSDNLYEVAVHAFTQEKNPDRAIKEFQRLIEINPSYDWGYYGLSMVYEKTGRLDEAMEVVDEGVFNIYDSALLHQQRGRFLRQRGELEEAILELEKAVLWSKDSADPHVELANIYLEKGNYKEAREYFRQALEIEPDNAVALAGQKKTRSRWGWFLYFGILVLVFGVFMRVTSLAMGTAKLRKSSTAVIIAGGVLLIISFLIKLLG